jgi:hypothetical protein
MSALSQLSTEEVEVLPKGTLVQLSCPAGEGDRRRQVKQLAVPMIANGLTLDRVYEILRPMYGDDFLDSELTGIIRWVANRKEKWTPSGKMGPNERPPVKRQLTKEEKIANAERWLNGFTFSPDLFPCRSVIEVEYPSPREIACFYLSTLHGLSSLINVVTDFRLDQKGIPHPLGRGVTRSVFQWIRFIQENGVPHSDAGCRVRLNPIQPINIKQPSEQWCGSGYQGAYTDGDVHSAFYVMLESDCLPMEMQVAVIALLPLPIKAILDTGGKSLHTNVALTAGAAEGRAIAEKLYAIGFDTNPAYPSCLERMPGDTRILGARDQGGTEQRLIYLNHQPEARPIHG